MKTYTIAYHSSQSKIKILPNTKQTLKNLPKTFKTVPNLVTLLPLCALEFLFSLCSCVCPSLSVSLILWLFVSIAHMSVPVSLSFSFIFGLFQTNINTIFTANQSENVHPVLGFKPITFYYESHAITIRPGLTPGLSLLISILVSLSLSFSLCSCAVHICYCFCQYLLKSFYHCVYLFHHFCHSLSLSLSILWLCSTVIWALV